MALETTMGDCSSGRRSKQNRHAARSSCGCAVTYKGRMIVEKAGLMEDPAECKYVEFILADLIIQYLASLLSSVVGLQDQTA
jgi:hypothetical protein